MVGVDGNILFENKFDKRPSYAVNEVFRIRDYDTNQYLYVYLHSLRSNVLGFG